VVGEVDKAGCCCTRLSAGAGVPLDLLAGLAQGSLDWQCLCEGAQGFGGSIGKLQLIQKMIADMAVKVETARMVVYKAAWLSDQGLATARTWPSPSTMPPKSQRMRNLAIQVHGGWGFMDDCPASRYLRDNRVCTIGDGSSQIQTY